MPIARCLCALLLCFSMANLSAASTPGEVPIGANLRDAELQGLNGPSRELSSFRGKPLLINVWASWCGPCRQEMASLERLAWQERYFAIIGISTDDYADKARGLLKGTNATISHFIDHDLQMENMLGASQLPLTVFVDANGRVLERFTARDNGTAPTPYGSSMILFTRGSVRDLRHRISSFPRLILARGNGGPEPRSRALGPRLQ